MKRNRGIAAVILGILICGILFTSFTVRLVNRQGEQQAWDKDGAYIQAAGGEQESAYAAAAAPRAAAAGGEDALPEQETETEDEEQNRTEEADSSPEDGRAEDGGESFEKETEKENEEQSSGEAAAFMARAAAPASESASLEADEKAGPGVMLEEDVGGTVLSEDRKTAEDFRRRLEEIDSQISEQRARNEASTTYDMWTLAENERKLWDSELNNIYGNIRSHIPEDRMEALVKEERAWIVSRDAKAAEDAEKYAGGTLESVEYAASLAASTRERAYELVETYGEYLR